VAMGLAAFSAERFVTLVSALIDPEEGQLRYVNAGHPPAVVWGRARPPCWLGSTGPLVSPALSASWDAATVGMNEGAHVRVYTDGVSETLADEDGRAEEYFTRAIEGASGGGAQLVDSILADVRSALGGQPQPDDLTLLTATLRSA